MLRMKELRGDFGAGYTNTSLDDTALLLGFGVRKRKKHTALEDALMSLRIAGWFLKYEAGVGALDDKQLQQIFDLWKTKEGKKFLRRKLKKVKRPRTRIMENPQADQAERKNGSDFRIMIWLLVLLAAGSYFFSLLLM